MNLIQKRYRRKMFISIGLFVSSIILALLLLIAYMGINAGHYTIIVNDARKVLTISEDPTFEKGGTTRLNSVKVLDANNISIEDLPLDNMDRDNPIVNEAYVGSHNGDNYLAYTFYAKNVGDAKISYKAEIFAKDKIGGIYEYLRVRLYHDGNHTTYAQATQHPATYKDADGYEITETRECIGSNVKDEIGNYVCSGKFPDRAEKFVDASTVARNEYFLESEGISRFTVVIWIEGDDLECLGKPDGNAIVLSMKLSVLDVVREENA